MQIVEIYSLSHPLTKEIRYIGKANNSKSRLKTHLSDSKRRNTPVYCWIRSLSKNGLIPELKVIEITDIDNWKLCETKQIEIHKNNGCKLLNIAKGGDEPFCDKKTRQANAIKVANSIHSNPKSKRLWELKQMIGCSLRWMRKTGRMKQHDSIINRLASKGIYV